MYAIKKNINKVLAAFLCACLLLSYNPAFGTTGTAWAADGDDTAAEETLTPAPYAPTGSNTDAGMGEATDRPVDTTPTNDMQITDNDGASTIIEASTYTSELQAIITPGPLYATVGQIEGYKDNSYPLIVQATCSETNDPKDYTFTWNVTANDVQMSDEDLAIINAKNYPLPFNTGTNVASTELNLKSLIHENPGMFQNDIKYVFTCTVNMTKEPAQTKDVSVTLFTVEYDPDKDDDPHSIYGNHRLEDNKPIVVAIGNFLTTADLDTEPTAAVLKEVTGPFAQEAIKGSTDYESFHLLKGEDGKPSQIYNVSVTGGLKINDELTLPATDGTGYDLYFPIDVNYVLSDENPTGYKKGDRITVLWKVNGDEKSDDLRTMQAEIVYDDPTDQLMAKVTYKPTEATGIPNTVQIIADGVTYANTTDLGASVPGFFTLVYSSNKTKPGEDEVTYYSVSATVSEEDQAKGNAVMGLEWVSTLTMDGTPVYVETGTPIQIEILPATATSNTYYADHYRVKSLTFKASPDATPVELIKSGKKTNTVDGITIDDALSCITLAEPLCDKYYSKFAFNVEFELVPSEDINGSGFWLLNASVVDADAYDADTDTYADSTNGLINVAYTKVGETYQHQEQGSQLTGVTVRRGGYVNLDFMVKAGIDETNYEITRVQTSATGEAHTWADAAWLPGCALYIPYMTSNMHVRVLVGKTDNTTIDQPMYYNVIIKAADGTDERCVVTPESAVLPVKIGSSSPGVSFNMNGVTDKVNGGYYPQYYTVTEGGNPPTKYDLENDVAKKTYADPDNPMTRTYLPSTAVKDGKLKGDIVIEVTFHTTNPTPHTLTLIVDKPEWGSASVVGGTQDPQAIPSVITKNEDGTFTVGSGEIYSVLMVPNAGCEIKGLVLKTESTNAVRPMTTDKSIAQTGVFSNKMPDEDLTITVYFGKIATSGLDFSKKRTLNVYVADQTLMSDPDTEYIWKTSEPMVDAANRVIDDFDIVAPEHGAEWGTVNSGTRFENMNLTVGDPYIMNFQGQLYESIQHTVSQVLVVSYATDKDGNKTVDGRRLYPWIAPTFDLNYNTAGMAENLDVIVFFKAIEESDVLNQPEDDSYTSLVITDDSQVLRDTIQPPVGEEIKVLPNGYLTITGMKLKPDYEWGGEDGEPGVTINGTALTDEELAELDKTGVLVVGPVPPSDYYEIVVRGHYVEPIVVPDTLEVGVDNPVDPGTTLSGGVTVSAASLTPSVTLTSVGETPVELPTLTQFMLGFSPDDGYQLTKVAFEVEPFQNPDDPEGKQMRAWYKKNVAEDGTAYNSLKFQETKPAGYESYNYTTPQEIEIAKGDETTWRVEGLLGNMTVLPTFEEIPPVVDPNDEAWKVQAGITAGQGLLYMEYDGKQYYNQVNVPKNSSRAVDVTITPVVGYKIKDVTAKITSSNPLENLWNWLTGGNIKNMTHSVEAGGGKLRIAPVQYDYEIYVEFENTDPNRLDTKNVPVNVYSDSNKGQVKPNTPVNVARDGEQQFTIDVKSLTTEDNGTKWYSIESLKVTPHYMDGSEVKTAGTVTVPAGENGSGIRWSGEHNVMFYVNISGVAALNGVPEASALSAVDVEVVYGPANLDNKPTPDVNNGVKHVTITSSTGGGVVSPFGSYDIYPYEVDGKWAEFLVVVAPAEGYGLKGLTVTRGGATNTTLANHYLDQINGVVSSSSGCFYIKADPTDAESMKNEVINIQFERLSTTDKTYTVHMRVVKKNGVSGTVVTQQPVTLPLDESFSYSVNTSGSNVGYTVTDKYSPTGGNSDTYENGYDVPVSAAMSPDKPTIARTQNNNCLTVNPAMIMNRVVDRWITVTFDDMTLGGLDPADKVTPINNNDKTSIKVNVYTAEGDEKLADELTISPNASLNNVLKSDDSHYLYSWWFNETGTQKNYYIYCVTVNKNTSNPLYGSITPTTSGLTKSGQFLFDKSTLTDKVNYLDIYVGEYLNGVVPDVSGGGGDIEVGWGEGGWVQNNNGSLAGTGSGGFGSISGYLSSFAPASGIDMNEALLSAVVDENGDGEDEGDGPEGDGPEGDGGDEGDEGDEGTDDERDGDEGDGEDGEDEGEGGDGDVGSGTVKPTAPTNTIRTYKIVPAPGYVIDHVYLFNCHPWSDTGDPKDSWAWITPRKALSVGNDEATIAAYAKQFGTSWEKEIVLQYTLEVDDSQMLGYMYASFEYKGISNIEPDPDWDPNKPENHDKLGVNNLSVHFYPRNYARGVASLIGSGSVISVMHEGSQGQDGTIAVRGSTTEEAKTDRYISTYSTIENIEPDSKFTFRVGPLLPEDNAINAADKLYTLDIEEMAKQMPNVTVEPVIPSTLEQSLSYNAEDGDLGELADDEQDGTQEQADEEATKYYKYYTVRGTAADLGMSETNKTVTLQLPLDKLTAASGEFPELPSLDKGTPDDNPNTPVTSTTYDLSVGIEGIGGTITPTSTAAVAAWNNGDTVGPWKVASGARVAFAIQADDDYRLTGLDLNGTDLLLNPANRYYTGDATRGTLAFPVYSNTQVVAQFTPRTDAAASRTVSISVQGGHGTTSPTPGDYPVEKGQPYSVRFVPESGYVPYRIWVDGVESFVSPTLVGWSLPASWSDQTFRVEYALEGTTPSGLNYLVQTGQNTAADLVRTGNNPIVIACVVGVAGLAAFGVWQMRRRKEAASRAAKYSVTKRK